MRNKSNFIRNLADGVFYWKCPRCGNDFSHLFQAERCDHKAIGFSIQCEYCGCKESFTIEEHKGVVELNKQLN